MNYEFNQAAAVEIFTQNREIIIAFINKKGGDVKRTMENMVCRWKEIMLNIDEIPAWSSLSGEIENHADICLLQSAAAASESYNELVEIEKDMKRSIMGAR
jgi:hypothetical protein